MAGALTALVVFAACTSTAPPEPTLGPTDGPSSSAPTPRPSDKTSALPVQRVSGRVIAGVESGCLLLATESGPDWLLLGRTRGLRAGQKATVEGRPDPSAVSTCQQGRPFRVSRVL